MELQTGAVRHVYVIKGIQRFFSILFGLLIAGIGVAFVWNTTTALSDASATFIFAIMAAFFALGSVYMFARVFRSRLILEGSRITIRDPLRERSADLREIEGFRTISTRNGSFKQLILKDNQGKITISDGFATDDDFSAWMQNVPDLDTRDRENALAAIRQDSELGATQEERLAALSSAKRLNIALVVITAAIAIGLNFGPTSLHKPAALLLALAPLVVLYLAARSPLLYAVLKRKSDPRTDLGGILMITAVGLFLQFVRFDFVSMRLIITYALPLGIVAVGVLLPVVRRGAGSSLFGMLFALVFFAGFYGFGLIGVADALFDSSTGTSYVAPVVGKHINHGKSTTYHLTLAPWGPFQRTNDLSVPRSEYDELQPGDGVCLALHPGRLNAPWYTPVSCPNPQP